MTYHFYTELLSKIIRGTITEPERQRVKFYEDQHPVGLCPHCRHRTRSTFAPYRVVHAPEECPKRHKK